jgi:hypothetical protein
VAQREGPEFKPQYRKKKKKLKFKLPLICKIKRKTKQQKNWGENICDIKYKKYYT